MGRGAPSRARRRIRALAGAVALTTLGPVAALGLTPHLVPGTTPPAGATEDESPRELAAEVCEPMVADAIEAVTGAKLPVPQQGRWTKKSKRFVCTYDVGGGTISLRVDILTDRSTAKAAYDRARERATAPTRLNGLGQAAFQAPDGLLVARKDQFLLTIDPSRLPSRLVKGDVSFAAVVAVMACW